MPQFDIRNVILKNLAGSSRDEIKGYINETIDNREDDALPGMGILFEVVWKKSNEKDRDMMMDKIMTEVGSGALSQ
jgi:small acid-soluble spore protein I (minor)